MHWYVLGSIQLHAKIRIGPHTETQKKLALKFPKIINLCACAEGRRHIGSGFRISVRWIAPIYLPNLGTIGQAVSEL